jgi:hypothetical protein
MINIILYLLLALDGNHSGGPQALAIVRTIKNCDKVVAVAVVEVVVPDLVNVVSVAGFCDVNLASVD